MFPQVTWETFNDKGHYFSVEEIKSFNDILFTPVTNGHSSHGSKSCSQTNTYSREIETNGGLVPKVLKVLPEGKDCLATEVTKMRDTHAVPKEQAAKGVQSQLLLSQKRTGKRSTINLKG